MHVNRITICTTSEFEHINALEVSVFKCCKGHSIKFAREASMSSHYAKNRAGMEAVKRLQPLQKLQSHLTEPSSAQLEGKSFEDGKKLYTRCPHPPTAAKMAARGGPLTWGCHSK